MSIDSAGALLCARYSFAPNSLHYCGPEKQADMLGYVREGNFDAGLPDILHRFDTLYAYLSLIASSNYIADPFDRRVVEAYWLGNDLLFQVKPTAFADHLLYMLALKKKLPHKKLRALIQKGFDGLPQHNFHVMNIFVRTGHHTVPHTITTMDQCRISWGMIERKPDHMESTLDSTQGQYLVKTRPLEYSIGEFRLGVPVDVLVKSVSVVPKVGDWVSIHWGYVCDVLTPVMRRQLQEFTNFALSFATMSHVLE